MTTQTAPSRASLAARIVIGVVGGLLVVGSAALLSLALSPLVIFAAFALVPAGLVYGAIVRVALARARRAAARDVSETADALPITAALERSRIQQLDQLLNLSLLGLYVPIAVLVVLDFEFGGASGRMPGLVGLLSLALMLLLLIAIPLSAVFTTMLAISWPRLREEAMEITFKGTGSRQIQNSRRLSWAVFVLYWVSGLGAVITISLLGTAGN